MKRHEAAMLYLGTGMTVLLATLLEVHNFIFSAITGALPVVFFIGSEIYLKRKY